MSELLYSLPSWDLQNLGVLNPDMTLGSFAVMDESSEEIFSSPFEYCDVSTGYLEDALVEFSERSKRRRLLFCRDDHQTRGFDDLAQSNWGLSENFSCMSQFAAAAHGISDEPKSTSVSRISCEEENNNFSEAISASDESPNSSSSFQKNYAQEKSLVHTHSRISVEPTSCSGDTMKNKNRVVTRVVYPFALVKPGGREDDVTLNDINERILMPPTRPVRHPVGDFACRPCVSANGPGLSGKAVVALTKIQTQGRGTITIIRTKG